MFAKNKGLIIAFVENPNEESVAYARIVVIKTMN